MKLIKLSSLFHAKYGLNLELNSLEQVDILDENSVNFVSRTEKNNGVSAIVKKVEGLIPLPEGTITVAGGGNSVLEAYLQPFPYYSGRDLFYLIPKLNLNEKELLYYCKCIKMNRYKYNYGRQANKTLGELLIPSIDSIPLWVRSLQIPIYIEKKPLSDNTMTINHYNWKFFKYDDIFKIEGGYYNKKPPENTKGNIPFVGASENNNGITSFHTLNDIKNHTRNGPNNNSIDVDNIIFKGNCITVANNGNSVASAFYQEKDFICTHDINILRLKNYELNPFIALFICTLIKKEKYRWSYGRKWRPLRMPESTIKLPIDKNENPDWIYMENYVKSLPYSSSI